MKETKEQILDFVRDHWQHFGAYPMEVETENKVLTWDQYWSYITEEEIKMLEDKYTGLELPTGERVLWEYTGFCYENTLSDNNERSYQHPKLEFLIRRYLDEQNADIREFNRDVQKEWKMDLQKYD